MPVKLAFAVALAAALLALPAAASAQLQCGDVITRDVTLDADLNCPGGASDPGLRIGASGVTLDLDGHVVQGGASAIANTGYDGVTIRDGTVGPVSVTGIELSAGARDNRIVDLTLRSGVYGISLVNSADNVIRRVDSDGSRAGLSLVRSNSNLIADSRLSGFDWGARLEQSHANRLIRLSTDSAYESLLTTHSHLNRFIDSQLGGAGAIIRGSVNVVAGNTIGGRVSPGGASGLALEGSANRVNQNRIVATPANQLPALEVRGGEGNVLRGNRVGSAEAAPASLGSDGVLVAAAATGTRLVDNLVEGFLDDGMDIDNADTILRRNSANRNGDFGIEAVPGVRGRGNRAAGNGNPAQCLNVFCD